MCLDLACTTWSWACLRKKRYRTLEGVALDYEAQVVEKLLALTLKAAKDLIAENQRQGSDHLRVAQAWLVQEQCTGTGHAAD